VDQLDHGPVDQLDFGLVDQLDNVPSAAPSLASPVLEMMHPESPTSLFQLAGVACQTATQGDHDQHITVTRGASLEGMVQGCIPSSPSSFIAKVKKSVSRTTLNS
jgi:hypothetical protein